MSVQATRARERSFRMVIRGADQESVHAALDAASAAWDTLQAEIADLRQQHAAAIAEIDRMTELERSLLRSCVAAEEDARIRCGAARRYATRIVAAAQEQAAARLDAPIDERDRIAREIEAMAERRRRAAEALAALIAGLERPADAVAVHNVEREASTSAEASPDCADAPANPQAQAGAAAAAHAAGEPSPLNEARGGVPTYQAAAIPPAAIDHPPAEPATEADSPAKDVDDRAAAWAPGTVRVAPPEPAGWWGGRRRVPLAAGSIAALLLVLQGSSGLPRMSGAGPAIDAASFAPAGPAAGMTQETPPSESSTAPPTVANNVRPLTIRLKPLRNCWVRVIVDDRTDARELQPGEDIVLEAERSIVLRVGDAAALSVEVNGRVLPPLGLNGQVVERRFTAATAPK